MRRLLGFFIVGLLFAGTAAACSSDSDSDTDSTTTTAAADSGGGSTDTTAGDSGGNADIAAYCASVQEFVDASQALASDPTDTDAQQTVTELGTQLATDAAALAAQASTFTADDAAQFEQCQTDFAG